MRIPLGCFLAAILIGFLGSRFFKDTSPVDDSVSPERRERKANRDRRTLQQQMEDSVAQARLAGKFDPFSGEWADWTEEELKSALEEGLKDPAVVLDGKEQRLVRMLFRAWCDKNLENAIAWWETTPSEFMQVRLSGVIGAAWPEDRGMEGLEFACAHSEQFFGYGSVASGQIMQKGLQQAVAGGVNEVASALKMLRESGLDSRYTMPVKFPDGFDFVALADTDEGRRVIESESCFFGGEWMKQDREAAFQSLVLDRSSFMKVFQLFNDRPLQNYGDTTTEEVERAGWVAQKLSKNSILSTPGVASNGALSMKGRPSMLAAYTEGFEDTVVRTIVAEDILRNSSSSGEMVISYLNQLKDPEWRISLLENTDSIVLTMSEKQLRENLSNWGASTEKIETIIKRYALTLRP
ncbi:hypothetical protein JIN85_11295 [Luteolibacter pohnpeiensis]|uniref:Uncharacterized protein n=1 Tax=Luteolibacter pohnpeiensis TaxID=454153 RepID=A0A934S860_9BACT|nr:hypothetical protein [Luteolibacter pohnpeiensis]MBK1883004.1 hypothetical protein [Luteolibacter pohnpeiensis]